MERGVLLAIGAEYQIVGTIDREVLTAIGVQSAGAVRGVDLQRAVEQFLGLAEFKALVSPL